MDRYDKRPDLNVPVLKMLVSGSGLRQIARVLDVDPRSVQQKLVKFGSHAAQLHQNLCVVLPAGRTFVLDEEETYEHAISRPLTVALLVDAETRLLVGASVGPIRRLARRGSLRRRRQDADERRNGRRPDASRRCVRAVLEQLALRVPEGSVGIRSDQKGSYATLIRELFGFRAVHETTSGRSPRTPQSPLFPINQTIEMLRDNCGRLEPQSWLVSKRAERLSQHLSLFTVFRNYVRRRFNEDDRRETAAVILGLLPRQLTWAELLAWRQDWGASSLHPMDESGQSRIGSPSPTAA